MLVIQVVSRSRVHHRRRPTLVHPLAVAVVQVVHRPTRIGGTGHAPAVAVGEGIGAVVGDVPRRVVLDRGRAVHILRLREPVAGALYRVGVGRARNRLARAVARLVVAVLGAGTEYLDLPPICTGRLSRYTTNKYGPELRPDLTQILRSAAIAELARFLQNHINRLKIGYCGGIT